MAIRVQRYIAQAGLASRRTAEEWIKSGRVKVNGELVQIGATIVPGVDVVSVNGQVVNPSSDQWVLALNKPAGYTTSMKDRHAAHLVTELIPDKYGRVFPIGRLDRETSGLILLTNDGDLAHRLSHPSFGVSKVYEAWVKGVPKTNHLERLEKGIVLDDGPAHAHEIAVVKREEGKSLVRLTLTEGRKREVRRIFAAVGHPVVSLKRISFGNIQLDDLAEGSVRPLTHREVMGLTKLATPSAQRLRTPKTIKTKEKVRESADDGPFKRHEKNYAKRAGRSTISARGSRNPVSNPGRNSSRPHR